MTEDVGACQSFIVELNRVGRLWDKNGVRLYPIIDRAVAALALCRDATDPQEAQAVLDVAVDLKNWIEAHRDHLSNMTDIVQTLLTTAHIAVEKDRWPKACAKGGDDAVESAVD